MKYAIFDLDGTLLDSMWVWENIDIEFLAKYNLAPSPQMREKVKVLSVRQATELFIEEFGLPQSAEFLMLEISGLGEEKYRKEVQLKPFVLEALIRLKEQEVRMCIATASSKNNVLAALKRLDLLKFFEFIITADDVKTGKDDPEIYNLCAGKFGAPASEIVVFEDSLHAIQTAKKAGFKVVGVYDKSSEQNIDIIKEISDFYLESMKDLEELI